MTKWSGVTPNSAPALADYLMGVTAGNVDDRLTIQTLVNLILNNKYLFNPYKFSYYRNAAFSLTSAGGIMGMDTLVFDTHSDYATGTGKFTAPVSGFYYFSGAITWGTAGTGSFNWAGLFKNGVEFSRSNRFTGAAGEGQAMVGKMVQLVAGDTIALSYASQATQSAEVGTSYQNYFEGFLICAT